MFTIAKTFTFCASHQLIGLPPTHQCSRLHGHNYSVTLELRTHTLNATGFVLDYGQLAPFKDWLEDQVEHRHLNDVVPFNTTAEHLAQWFYDVAISFGWPVTAVQVSETTATMAEYRP